MATDRLRDYNKEYEQRRDMDASSGYIHGLIPYRRL